VAVKLDRKSL